MVIDDSRYIDHSKECSTFNYCNFKHMRKFKSHALKKYERLISYTETFGFLNGSFHHISERFKTCFEAVCVICQYIIEINCLLFFILIEQLVGYSYNKSEMDNELEETDNSFASVPDK